MEEHGNIILYVGIMGIFVANLEKVSLANRPEGKEVAPKHKA